MVGNFAYSNAPPLVTPGNDAEDIAGALERLGFDVDLRKNVSGQDLAAALQELSKKSAVSDISVVYFSGYGMSVKASDFLIPVDAASTSPLHGAVSIRTVVPAVAGVRKLGLIILDAQRGNPFSGVGEGADGHDTRAGAGGGGHVQHVLMFFAAGPGKVSEEGHGRNSPLAAGLLKFLDVPELEINFLLRKVRDEVRNATQQKQTPYMYGELAGERIFLNAVKSMALPCDRLAAERGGVGEEGAAFGVALGDIKVNDAVAACSDATSRFPGVSRFHYQLGRAYRAAKDYTSALASYQKAFRLGDAPATYALGLMYQEGDGVGKDPALARFYLELASEMKFTSAFVSLGLQYELGVGGARDAGKAFELYERASDAGDASGSNKMAELLEKGVGHKRDLKGARALYEKGAAMGSQDAVINLARCHANGIGGRKDVAEARRLLERAAESGNSAAKSILSSLKPGGKESATR